MRLAILYVCLMCLLSLGPGCRDKATSSDSQKASQETVADQVPVPPVAVAETGGTAQSPPSVDPLVAYIDACQWPEFEKGLLSYMSAHPAASEAADRRLAELITAVARRQGTDETQKYDHWLGNTCRVILRHYQPIDIELQSRIVRNIGARPGFSLHKPVFPDMSERAKNARLIIDTWKRIDKLIDPTFDSKDMKNWPTNNYVPGAGDRYQPNTDPDEIVEPEIRTAYLKIIAENRRKSKVLSTQIKARDCAPKLRADAFTFLEYAYGSPPEAMDEYRGFLTELGIKDPEPYVETAHSMINIMKDRVQMLLDNEALLKQFPPDDFKDDTPKPKK